MYYVYMLRCRDGSLYTGTAADLCRRMRQHAGGGSACARYTRAHPPRELAGVWRTERQGDALRLEYAVKQLTPAGKAGPPAASGYGGGAGFRRDRV